MFAEELKLALAAASIRHTINYSIPRCSFSLAGDRAGVINSFSPAMRMERNERA